MTEEEALAIARVATRQAMDLHRTKEAAMRHLNQKIQEDHRLMTAFAIVGHLVVDGAARVSH